MRPSVVVFDFDGTLADTRVPIVAAMRAACADVGLDPPAAERIHPLIGRGLGTICADLGCPPGAVDRLAARYKERFEEVSHEARLFAGAADLLAALEDAGARLAIATNRGLASLERILDAVAARARFALLVSGTCVTHEKPHPEMLQRVGARFGAAPDVMMMVGDTTLDVEMGRNAGASTCAVTWGAHGRPRLEDARPTHVVDSVADLRGVLLGRRPEATA